MAKRKWRQIDSMSDAGSPVTNDPEGPEAEVPGSRTRKARKSGGRRIHSLAPSSTASESEFSDDGHRAVRRQRELSHVKPGTLAFPRSAYEGYQPRLPVTTESQALRDLLGHLRQQRTEANERSDFGFVALEDFSVYRPPRDPRRPNELAGLEKLQVHRGASDGFLFDGILRVGTIRRYVQGVPFKIVTVEGYGDEAVTDLSDRICLQSALASRSNIWYQLGRPSREYARFYEPFLWLAEFAKHFVDYMLEMERVTMAGEVQAPRLPHYSLCPCSYLWNECWGVETGDIGLLEHPIWGEVDPYNLKAIEQQPNLEHKTVVTPFVQSMFKHMYFSAHLDARQVASREVLRKIQASKAELGLTPFGPTQPTNTALLTPNSQRSTSPMTGSDVSMICKGDVICLDADREGVWKDASSTWYAYVQGQRVNEQTQATLLDVLWLYEPHDTTLGAAYYPYQNELFLSDNCECGRDALDARHVKGKINVSWFASDPHLESGLFVRQKFRAAHNEGTDDFVSLQDSDFQCRCGTKLDDFEDCRLKYDIGDAVLENADRGKSQRMRLDPAIIVDFDLGTSQVVLRELQRKSEIDKVARPNELLLTDTILKKSPLQIIRQCQVRIFSPEIIASGLPTGYDRDGAGDFYFIDEAGLRNSTVTRAVPLPPLNEGTDLVATVALRKLTGLGMFCGGGNFDRGLEDSGIVDFRYAVDWAERAMYTYRANSRKPDETHCFLGSVNDYLSLAMNGTQANFMASPGKIGLISAGSPCPGFSTLQRDKASEASLRNASMVASVVSFVDVFCPKYCILENVVTMTTGMGSDKKQNVFAQVIAAFVALGYQCQQFLMDPWSHGSPQSRSRVFIIASAPGLEPFPLPQLSHDHPRTEVCLRGLGKSSNGRSFGVRRNEYTPFECVTAAEAANLPDIADGQSRICPQFPDHRMPSEEDA